MQDNKYRTIEMATEKELDSFDVISSNKKWRPRFHINPPYGLLNDPNGFCYFNNEYHLFYQWFPFGTFHGMKHWRHVVSKNLIEWEDKGVKISPTQGYESHGAYSGAAFINNDNAYLFYTGNLKKEHGRDANQCVATLSNTGAVHKSADNPIIRSVPKGYTGHVRDPKVIQHDGHFYMLLGAQREVDLQGCIIVYESSDLSRWAFKGELTLSYSEALLPGYMYECPDLLQVDGQDVLIFSPQGVKPEGTRFHNLNNVVYCLGVMDWHNLEFEVEHWDELDKGFDFYAPQTMANSPSNATLIAWAGTDERLPTEVHGWINCLTLPRELSIKGERLHQVPTSGLFNTLSKAGSLSITDNGSDTFELTSLSFMANINVTQHNSYRDDNNEAARVKIALSGDGNNKIEFVVCQNSNRIILNRTNYDHHESGWEFGSIRECEYEEQIEDITLICDQSILEIYVNKGKYVFTSLFFPNDTDHYLNVCCNGNTSVNMDISYTIL